MPAPATLRGTPAAVPAVRSATDAAADSAGPARRMPPRHGFTLVELCVVMTVAALLAALAVPGWRDRVLQARRSDAVEALTRLQAAQEGYRAHHGLYAATLAELGAAAAATSREGHYGIALQRTAAEAYEARASARGAQAADAGCAALTLQVTQGFAVTGPTARCWNR